MKKMALVSALVGCSGCSVMVQNRYSVLGIDGIQLDSAAEAMFWSRSLLIGVGVGSALLAVLLFWLGQRWLHRRRMRAIASFQSEQQMSEPEKALAAEGTPPSAEGAVAIRQS